MREDVAPRSGVRRSERGYVMLMLLLALALLAIFAAVIVPSITFNIRRDREEEMIHRGVQYSRAIRAYYKKFGRYPTKIEDLESANNLRFLRKRYKDPITGQDFKLLHFGEAKLTLGGIGGAGIAGASSIGANGALTGGATGSGFSQPSAFGGNGDVGLFFSVPTLNDDQIAAVINYVRSSFGNHFKGRITAVEVKALRRPNNDKPEPAR